MSGGGVVVVMALVGGGLGVEPGGKGCAVIRSLRGGMRSVVGSLSLRIRAEPHKVSREQQKEEADGGPSRHRHR